MFLLHGGGHSAFSWCLFTVSCVTVWVVGAQSSLTRRVVLCVLVSTNEVV